MNKEVDELVAKPRAARSKGTSHRNRLHAFLVKRLKGDPMWVNGEGNLRTPKIAKAVGHANEAVYKWLREDKITVRGAQRIVKAFPRKFKLGDFLGFFSDTDYNSIPARDMPTNPDLSSLV